MKFKMWGTRGSLPRALNSQTLSEIFSQVINLAKSRGITTLDELGEQTQDLAGLGYTFLGGQTTSWEVSSANTQVLVDMGSGITDACYAAMDEGRNEFDICLTHMHWDHIMGLPFFVPVYSQGHKIRIHHIHPKAPEHVRLLFNGVNFPVSWKDLTAEIEFIQHKLHVPFQIGDFNVAAFALDHPGGSFGYRFEHGGKSLAIGIDGEYKRVSPKELGKDLRFYQNLDALIFDAQYEMNELASRYDWGHSSPPIGVDLALREGIRNLVLAHHDPRGSETRARRMLEHSIRHRDQQLKAHAKSWQTLQQPQGPNIILGYDGLVLDLDNL